MPTPKIATTAAHELVLEQQHPALKLALLDAGRWREGSLPSGSGCYVLLSLTTQRCYVGESGSLSSRLPASLAANMPGASHVLVAQPTGLPWSDAQRLGLESLLIASLPGVTNKAAGSRWLEPDDYLNSVADSVLSLCCLLLNQAQTRAGGLPSQASVARELVMAENGHPLSISDLVDRLRELGWPMTGATPWATLRRDLKQPGRGGLTRIRASGKWSDGETLIYVQGRRYASGWRPTARQRGVEAA